MIHIKDHKTERLFGPWSYLGPKRKKLLDQSWAGLFKEHILNELPVSKIASYFKEGFGRPTKELYCAVGVLVLQQTFDLADEETVRQLAFNTEWHYALDITEETDEAKYMSLKTLWNFRKKVIEKELDADIFSIVTDKFLKVFKVNTDKQRLDSVHIRSNMKRLGRINIFARSIHGFLVNLKRHHREAFQELPDGYNDKYLTDKAVGCFSMVKPTESDKTLAALSADLYELVERFKGDEKISLMTTYKLLQRVLSEHCKVDLEASAVTVKASKEVPSDSLQNPSDPDASYDGHKGQGYQVQVMETYGNKNESGQAQAPNLITYIKVEPAHNSDANALIPAIQSTVERGLEPKEILADSLYGSDANKETAKAIGVDMVSPVMGQIKGLSISDFEKTETGVISKCPEGFMPQSTKMKGGKHIAVFKMEHCSSCARLGTCPVSKGKIRYDEKQLRLAARRQYQETAEFKERYRYRSGVESTLSTYDRLTGVKRLRVRGLAAVRFCGTLKALGVNIFRAAAFRVQELRAKEAAEGGLSAISCIVLGFYGFIKVDFGDLRQIDTSRLASNNFKLYTVA